MSILPLVVIPSSNPNPWRNPVEADRPPHPARPPVHRPSHGHPVRIPGPVPARGRSHHRLRVQGAPALEAEAEALLLREEGQFVKTLSVFFPLPFGPVWIFVNLSSSNSIYA